MSCFEDAMKRDDVTPVQSEMVTMARALMELAKSTAGDGEVPPVMAILTEDGTRGLAVVGGLFTEEARDEAPMALRELLRETKAKAYVLMSESWMLPQSAMQAMKPALEEAREKGEEFELARPISEDDRRISIVSLSGESVEGDVLFAAFRIDEKNGRAIDLEKEETFFVGRQTDKARAGGRLSGLLREPAKQVRSVVTRAMVREAAQAMGKSEEEIEKLTADMGVEVVEDMPDEAVLVCARDDVEPGHDRPVVKGKCCECGRGIYHSPHAPQSGRKVCVSCVGVVAEREARG